MFLAIRKFLSAAAAEMHHVQWPTQQHAIRVSIITLCFVIFATVLLSVLDSVLSSALF